jgi:hypothetical protein
MYTATKIFLVLDLFYSIVLPYTLYFCAKYYDNNAEEMWKHQPPIYLNIVSWGIIIIMLQIIYFPIAYFTTGKL